MSNLLEFPPCKLPYSTRSPPHTVFAISGFEIDNLPPHIPLNMVLHFAPKFRDWLLPAPSAARLPKSLCRLALRKPFTGIDICCDGVTALGLKWVIRTMLQASGLAHSLSTFPALPSLRVAVSIYRTWIALELPVAGAANLVTHIQTQLMIGAQVTVWDMDAIWAAFPHHSSVVRTMGMNFIRSYINADYSSAELLAITDWCLENDERRVFIDLLGHMIPKFSALEKEGPTVYGNGIGLAVKEMTDIGKNQEPAHPENSKTQEAAASEENTKAQEAVAKQGTVLERSRTQKLGVKEIKQRFQQDTIALESRLKRTKSIDSIRSVETAIWNPLKEAESDPCTRAWSGPQRFTKAEIIAMTPAELEAATEQLSGTEKEYFALKTARYRRPKAARGLQATAKSIVEATTTPLDAYHTACSVAASTETGDQPKPEKLSALQALKQRKLSTICKKFGREKVEEANEKSQDSRTCIRRSLSVGQESAEHVVS